MAKETFQKARERLFKELPAHGFKVVTYNMGHTLKVPYVIPKSGRKYMFHSQSIHEGELSLWMDIRGMSAVAFASAVEEHERRYR